MRKKTMLSIIFLSLFFIMLSGCSNNKEIIGDLNAQILTKNNDIDELNSTINENKIEITKLDSKLKSQQTLIDSLHNELEEIKNGAQMQLVEIRNSFEREEYQAVISKALIIHEKFNGTLEDKEAQELSKISAVKKKELELAKKAEEDKLAADALKTAQDKAREIIGVSKAYPGSPNSADGVDLYIHWRNNSDKTIKYIYFEVVPYNAVNDIVSSEISRTSTFRGQETGPIKPGASFGSERLWKNAWYNNTIKSVKLQKIEIIYIDDTSLTLTGEDINYIQY